MTVLIVPSELKDANAFVERLHRHHKPVTGHRWSFGVVDDDATLRGVAIIGRPVARGIDQHAVVEVLRVCTDGARNACSALYGAACRQQKAHGYAYCQTYILSNEPGTSLRAAGWKPVAFVGGRSWSCKTRPRTDSHPLIDKVRWECRCSPNPEINPVSGRYEAK